MGVVWIVVGVYIGVVWGGDEVDMGVVLRVFGVDIRAV